MKKLLIVPVFMAFMSGCGGGGGTSPPADLSSLGHVFYPTITNNSQLDTNYGSFAIVVTNPSTTLTANIQVTRGAIAVTTQQVLPGSASVITLPWITELLNATTTLVVDGAYRVESDEPVGVYQYNPLDYTKAGGFTYTNDASLLLPESTWGDENIVVARNHWTSFPGLYAVTAREDNTTVTVTPSGGGGNVISGGGIATNGTGTVTLNQGDVLHVSSLGVGGTPDSSDLTGTLISTDKPVQVIGGHVCTNVPYNVQFCDHLEESMIPLQSAGFSYVVAAPWLSIDTIKARNVRIIGTEDNTSLTYDPPQAGAPSILNAGAYAEIDQTSASFMITADKKVLVAQYMLGQAAGGGAGDPAMTLAVPVLQYMSDYIIHAPTNYPTNYLNIIALSGTLVTVDGSTVTGFVDIGTSGYSVSRVQLSNAGDGNHTVSATNPVSLSVYGYGQYTSYWYPGGLKLNIL